jgi:hypothetical protein
MSRRLFLTFACFALIGCASGPSAYGPAQSYDAPGFRTTKIQSDRFRVSYTASNPQEAQDFALLRAAQVTLDAGYSYFEIMGSHMSGNGPSSGLSSSVGVGFGGGGYRRGGTSVGVGLGVNDVLRVIEGDRVTNSIEITLLSSKSAGANVYEAQSIVDSIRPQVFTGP